MITTSKYIIDLQMFSGEKTEKATPKRQQEARKKGQVAKSMDLSGALILFFTFLSLSIFGGFFKEKVFHLFTISFKEYLLWELTKDNVMTIFYQLLMQGALLILPIFLVVMVVGIVSNYAQVGVLFTTEPLTPKFSKLNPLEGAKRIFSMRSLVDLIKSLLKLLVVGFVAYFTLSGEKEKIIRLSSVPLEDFLSFTSGIVLSLGLKVGIILIVLALFDYMYQKFEHEKSLRMSLQDIKDEHKKTEGDPKIKGKIRQKQMQMAMSRMMQEVPKADVIITNPTHFAIAIVYDGNQMDAPRVVAKGADYVALKIREIAKQNGIIMMENKPLARALYDKVEIGQAIPPDLFQSVAEVLAYVYKLKRRA